MTLSETQLDGGAVPPPGQAESRLPLRFGSPSEEYAAAASSAAVFDLGQRTLVELAGGDRVRFLHSFCTNDIKRLRTGQGCEAFVTNVKGRVIAHVWVDVTDASLWLDADPGLSDRLVPHLERYIINEDVQIADRTADWGELLVIGPEADGRLLRLGLDVAGLTNLDHTLSDVFAASARIRRFDVPPHRGYAILMRRDRLAECWQRLREADIRPAGSEAWSALRIEAGLPVFGIDISDDNLAQECGRTKSAISFTKGCYLGQEPIARLDALGHVNRELRSLRLAGSTVPERGAAVFADEKASTAVGTVTSAAFSFRSNSPVAMALLRSSASACGNRVFVKSGDTLTAAAVFWEPADS